MDINEYYDELIARNIATSNEIDLVTSIIGWSTESLDKILYARTGYRSLNQIDDHDGV